MKKYGKIEKYIREKAIARKKELRIDPEVEAKITGECSMVLQSKKSETYRRKIMFRLTKIAAAAVVLIAVVFGITLMNGTLAEVSASEILQDAVDAVNDIWSVHMKAKMRTRPGDNFGNVSLNLDLVDIEMWKYVEEDGTLKWRVEKPGRVLLMDGEKTMMFIRPNYGVMKKEAWPLGCFDSWMGRLLNVGELLDNELQMAKAGGREMCVLNEEIYGREKIVLEVEAKAKVAGDDYLRNKFIFDSDRLMVYRFDAETKLLEDLKIYVQDVLIFEVTDIEYNEGFGEDVFELDLPEDMVWSVEPEVLANNEYYENMGPREAAEAFFTACSEEDWDEVLKFLNRTEIPERMKNYLGGLEIVSIGEPFTSDGYASKGKGFFVPYEIKFKPYVRAALVSKDNPADRFVITGWSDENLEFKDREDWSAGPEVLPNNAVYVEMSAEDVVRSYYDSFAELDFEEMSKFVPVKKVDIIEKQMSEALRLGFDVKANLPEIEIQESYWSEGYSAYVVVFKEFNKKKFNLAIRKDNAANRFVVDGGL